MTDLDVIKPTNFTKNKNPGDLKQQIGDAGSELKQRAGEALQATKDMARDKFSEATDAAQDVANGAVGRIKDRTREQQQSGANYVERLAGNFREAATAFEKDVPFAARGINSAADYVEEAAAKIRDGSFRDLVEGATDFAKRQPAAFLGISVLAGFAAVRFLKASGEKASVSQTDASSGPTSSAAWQSPQGSGS